MTVLAEMSFAMVYPKMCFATFSGEIALQVLAMMTASSTS